MKLYTAASVPVLLALLMAGFCGLLLLEWLRAGGRRVRPVYLLAIAGYMCVYIVLTFLVRGPSGARRTRLMPFYSLTRLLDPGEERTVQIFREVLLNILLYVPLGALVRAGLPDTEKRPFLKTVLAGLICTLLTEILQYALNLGLAEADDVIHNMLGLLIGIGGYRVAREAALALRGRNPKENEAG